MRLGVFGGTFDPIHVGHLRSAEEMAEDLALDRVLFVPCAQPPHKRGRAVAPPHHRLAMVRLAIAGNRRFRASEVELERGGTSYSVDTLRALRAKLGTKADLFFLIGIDAFVAIGSWKEYAEIFALAHVAVTSRPPTKVIADRRQLPVAVRKSFCYGPDQRELIHKSGHRVLFRHVTALDISASEIRRLSAEGQSVRYLLPSPVERYIQRHGLYGRRRRTT